MMGMNRRTFLKSTSLGAAAASSFAGTRHPGNCPICQAHIKPPLAVDEEGEEHKITCPNCAVDIRRWCIFLSEEETLKLNPFIQTTTCSTGLLSNDLIPFPNPQWVENSKKPCTSIPLQPAHEEPRHEQG